MLKNLFNNRIFIGVLAFLVFCVVGSLLYVQHAERQDAKELTDNSDNPPPFQNIPVNLSDFEATKAFMVENLNFVKENWDPIVFNFEVRKARIHIANILSHADSMLCFYTPEQRKDISTLSLSLLLYVSWSVPTQYVFWSMPTQTSGQ